LKRRRPGLVASLPSVSAFGLRLLWPLLSKAGPFFKCSRFLEVNLFGGDTYKWSRRLTGINIANKYALYNFLSTFSGTHYVTPRALTAEIGFHF
jgi:hypothetical protein